MTTPPPWRWCCCYALTRVIKWDDSLSVRASTQMAQVLQGQSSAHRCAARAAPTPWRLRSSAGRFARATWRRARAVPHHHVLRLFPHYCGGAWPDVGFRGGRPGSMGPAADPPRTRIASRPPGPRAAHSSHRHVPKPAAVRKKRSPDPPPPAPPPPPHPQTLAWKPAKPTEMPAFIL